VIRMPRIQGRPPRLPGSTVFSDRQDSFIAVLPCKPCGAAIPFNLPAPSHGGTENMAAFVSLIPRFHPP
jgi:hypothetical protein